MLNKHIAIFGAGTMGTDLALVLSKSGYKVIINDTNENKILNAKKSLSQNLKTYKMLNSVFKDTSIESILSNITFTYELKSSYKDYLIIENINENWLSKKALYSQLNDLVDNDTLIAINTSCIPITKAASCFDLPQKVIGMHFMNPIPLINIVEVIRGYHTSEATVEFSKEFIASMNKIAIVVNDSPGFVANRLSHLFMNEAAFLVQENIATPKQIDLIFKKGYNHSMGPLETADLIGIDTVVDSLQVLYENFQDPKFRCCPLLQKMVNAGLLGKKSGEGFYKYC